jgi:hypothetical protein
VVKLEDIRALIDALPDEAKSSPAILFPHVIEYYRLHRLDDVVEEDGDGLLFQWGVWGPDEKTFYVDLTRQAVVPCIHRDQEDEGEDADILQLRCTFEYPPDQFRGLESGNLWCFSPRELPDFEAFVFSSVAVTAVRAMSPLSLDINLDDVE